MIFGKRKNVLSFEFCFMCFLVAHCDHLKNLVYRKSYAGIAFAGIHDKWNDVKKEVKYVQRRSFLKKDIMIHPCKIRTKKFPNYFRN